MTAQISIRKMREEDLAQVARIEAENFSAPWKEKDFRHYLDDPQALFLTAVIQPEGETDAVRQTSEQADLNPSEEDCLHPEEEIAGYIGCLFAADEGDITNVSVDSTHRREGTGSCLVQTLQAESRKRGCRRIFLEVRQSNDAAIRLYQNQGFVRIGVRKNYYTKPQEDALLMRCDLS